MFACIVFVPVGFFMVMFGGHTATVLAGEIVFGLAAGAVYYAALYYAMVVKHASVDAGGAHESMIGLGFAVGPLAGLIGVWLSGPLGDATLGMIVGVAPLILLCAVGALVPLIARR